MTFRLHAVGGLCNRLRALLSYRALYGEIQVMWVPDSPIAMATWADVFEPLPGLEFTPYVQDDWDAEDFAPTPKAPAGWEKAYLELRPKPAIVERVRRLLEGLGPDFSAMHIRRTDHLQNFAGHQGRIASDRDYAVWANQLRLPVYLATDNGQTQRRIRDLLAVPLHLATPLSGQVSQSDSTRHGTLGDAVVDLLVCGRSRHFMGSYSSSFSDTIEILRGLR